MFQEEPHLFAQSIAPLSRMGIWLSGHDPFTVAQPRRNPHRLSPFNPQVGRDKHYSFQVDTDFVLGDINYLPNTLLNLLRTNGT